MFTSVNSFKVDMTDCNKFIVIFYDFKIQLNYLDGSLKDNYLIPTF